MKKLIAILFVIIQFSAENAAWAQKAKTENLPNFDARRIHFGFSLAYNRSDFDLTPAADLSLYDSIRTITTDRQPGFNLGIICDLHLHPYFNLRFVPALSFAQRNIDFGFSPNTPIMTKGIESTFLDFPVHLKYRSARQNNFAAYVIGGAKYSYDLSSQVEVENVAGTFPNDIILKLKKHDYSLDLGVGFDFFLEGFKFSPELRVSWGLPNILVKDGTMFSDPISKLNSRILLVSLNFEG